MLCGSFSGRQIHPMHGATTSAFWSRSSRRDSVNATQSLGCPRVGTCKCLAGIYHTPDLLIFLVGGQRGSKNNVNSLAKFASIWQKLCCNSNGRRSKMRGRWWSLRACCYFWDSDDYYIIMTTPPPSPCCFQTRSTLCASHWLCCLWTWPAHMSRTKCPRGSSFATHGRQRRASLRTWLGISMTTSTW